MTIKNIWLVDKDRDGNPIKTLQKLIYTINNEYLPGNWKNATDIHYLITKEGNYAAIAHF